MQSVNEELQTINTELNNKNELLTRLNSDMQNLLESTQIATVFLDGQLRIKYFTPTLLQLFPVRDSDRGRPITDILSGLTYTELQGDVDTVQRNGTIVERDLALKDGAQTFVMRIRLSHGQGRNRWRRHHLRRYHRAQASRCRPTSPRSLDRRMTPSSATTLTHHQQLEPGGPAALWLYGPGSRSQPASILIPRIARTRNRVILERISRGECAYTETVRQRKDGSLFDISPTVSPIKAQGRGHRRFKDCA
jgi:hypothetical protein